MGLIIYKDAKGGIRPTWWGRVTFKGKAHEKNLNVPITGSVPMDANGKITLSVRGDDSFERSRRAANKVLEAWRKETRTNPAELQEAAFKAHTGVSMSGVPFSKLIEKWQGIIRTRPPTAERTRNAKVTFDRFATFAREFAAERGGRCETLNDVTPSIAAGWFRSISGTFAPGTVKDMIHLMSGAFRRWSTNGQNNPFSDIVLRGSKEAGEEKKRTERKALTPDQFAKLMDFARENERLYPLIVCAAFTGMRIGDICHLKVADCDLDEGTIDCVTGKTGVRCRIPIIDPALREVLTKHCAIPADGSERSPFAFPWAARQYDQNRTAIIRSVKPIFGRAIYGDEPPAEDAKLITDTTPDIAAAVAKTDFSEQKRSRVIEVYNRIKAGQQSSKVASEMGLARGQVSAYLKDAERLTGENLRPRASKSGKAGFNDLLERTRVERKIGRYAASVWGWHNLRHHFITCALNRGVPLYKIQAIVGHTSASMTAAYADTETQTDKGSPNVPALRGPKANAAMIQAVAAMSPEQIKAMSAMTPEQIKAMMLTITK